MMQRRDFLTSSVTGLCLASAETVVAAAQEGARRTAGPESVFFGHPVVSGPSADALVILQGVNGPASGFVELAVGDGPFERVDAESAGLLPYDANVLKFRLPALPQNQSIRYRVTARRIEFKTDYNIQQGPVESTPVYTVPTLDTQAARTKFVVWNDTHENLNTIRQLQEQTAVLQPDFLMWNGDQTNNVHDPRVMREQYLSPGQLEISARWPLAYARGNHDLRGPAARLVHQFTGTPEDRFYYAFRSGPVAALVMDTGEDKPDDRDVFAELAAFEPMRQRQTEWLARVIEEDWFRSAPFRILFCHIPLWWNGDVSKYDFWLFSEVCRDAWLPLLLKGKVQLVVSGHTHQATWLPPTADQPIGQLIGGGPQQERATLMEGIADHKALTLICRFLDGREAYKVEVTA